MSTIGSREIIRRNSTDSYNMRIILIVSRNLPISSEKINSHLNLRSLLLQKLFIHLEEEEENWNLKFIGLLPYRNNGGEDV